MTRDEFKEALCDAIDNAITTNVTLTSTNTVAAYNNILTTMYTVDPTKKPIVKRITDIEFV